MQAPASLGYTNRSECLSRGALALFAEYMYMELAILINSRIGRDILLYFLDVEPFIPVQLIHF